jgi:LysM repeat protein
MALDCVVFQYGTPGTALPTQYVVKYGDTLVKIAKAHGFADWREIYYHPDNYAFRTKRPDPDKIYPGDVLKIPARGAAIPPGSHPHTAPPPPPGPRGSNGHHFVPHPLALNVPGSRLPESELNYKHPGNVKVRVTLFWVTNCAKIDTSPRVLIARTEEIYRRHGLTLDIIPGRDRTEAHTIEFPDRLIEQEEYNSIRLEAHKRFNDQKSGDGRQRLPIFFCAFRDPDNGLTIEGDWLPYCFVSGNLTADRATMAHEPVHAAGIKGHLRRSDMTRNLMHETTQERSEMVKFQVQTLAGAYFSG